MIYRKLPWQWIKGEQLWQANGVDCQGRCHFGAGRLWRFFPGVIYPGTVSYFDGSGFLTGYQSMVIEGIMPDLSPEEVAVIPARELPDDIFVDKRTIKQMQQKCCPPQLAAYTFEGVEMI